MGLSVDGIFTTMVTTMDAAGRLVIPSDIRREAAIEPGTPLDVPIAINLPGPPVEPGGRFEWRLTVNGEAEGDWRLPFSTRAEDEAAV